VRIFLLFLGTMLSFGGAQAKTEFSDVVAEVRLGVLAFNPDIGINPENNGEEGGVNLQGEILFQTPSFLKWKYLFSPEPFIVGSVNTAGDTNYGGIGLSWDWQLGKKKLWELETGFGYIIHSGEIDIPFPNQPGNADNQTFDDENILFGSRDLFRTTIGINRHINERWDISFVYEHLSHGQILGSGRNQGTDSLGGRVSYRFGSAK